MKVLRLTTTSCTSLILKSPNPWISGITKWDILARPPLGTSSSLSKESLFCLAIHCQNAILASLGNTLALPVLPLTHKSTQLLELVHCDLCGPFPVLTLHGKEYLIDFLEDSANILKVFCLACKDQSAKSFQIVRANWERTTGKKILCFHVNGAGELAIVIVSLVQSGYLALKPSNQTLTG